MTKANARYAIGIDLGTTNSVLAYMPLESEDASAQLLPVPQLVDAQTVESRSSLPSFLHQAPSTATNGQWDLPWATDRTFGVGEWARRQAADVPERTVSAAKSWLSHAGVDRRAAILPWQAPPDVELVSPVEAAQRYLEHLVAAWDQAHPDAPIQDQHVIVTVPASFDTVARELTREAALAAGLPNNFTFLEEPQAAVYAWLHHRGDAWRDSLRVGDVLLVCDVGGGTTDLTLIAIDEADGALILDRIAVGNHLLVGGDNMDLALAHQVASQFAEKGTQLDPWQSVSLWHSCRKAKETLLKPDGPASHSISVLGRGSKLIGGTVSVEVDRQAAVDLLVEGFFPQCALQDVPQHPRAAGFQELGLPFEADTAITRHVAAFLSSQTPPRSVTHVLFNGGVFQADALQTRLIEVLNSWRSEGATVPLPGTQDLDHAVALGAAYYGRSKITGGIRIRGGVGRSYYVGIESAGLAIPGAPRPLRALCVVPFGMEEGTERAVPAPPIGLVHGEQAEFRFFSSATRQSDEVGHWLSRWSETELTETSPLMATLPADDQVTEPYVPVTFESRVTELGMCELWCVSQQSDRRWKLEFSVRDAEEAAGG